MGTGINVFNASTGVSSPRPTATPRPEKAEPEQSYLGMVPPARFLKPRLRLPTPHTYLCVSNNRLRAVVHVCIFTYARSPDVLESHATKRTSLVPIRVEFETDTHRNFWLGAEAAKEYGLVDDVLASRKASLTDD